MGAFFNRPRLCSMRRPSQPPRLRAIENTLQQYLSSVNPAYGNDSDSAPSMFKLTEARTTSEGRKRQVCLPDGEVLRMSADDLESPEPGNAVGLDVALWHWTQLRCTPMTCLRLFSGVCLALHCSAPEVL